MKLYLQEVNFNPKRSTGYDSVVQQISKYPEVQSVRLVSGEYDLSVLV